MDWEELFSASASKMKADLRETRASVEHRGLKGNLNEHTFSEWLRSLLPGVLEVATGEVINSAGRRSRQIDVVVSQSIDKRIDCVCVLDKGLLVHSGPEGLQPIPMPNWADP
jgi:hypothetical protein